MGAGVQNAPAGRERTEDDGRNGSVKGNRLPWQPVWKVAPRNLFDKRAARAQRKADCGDF